MSGPRTLTRHYVILKILRELKPKSILEVGFGNGDLLLKLNSKGFSGLGIDFSKEACEEFKKKTRGKELKFEIRNCSVEELVGVETFDLLLACEVLEHIEGDLNTLKNWYRPIKRGGHILLSIPAHMKMQGYNDDYAGHIRRYEKKELISKLKSTNFEVVKFYSYGYPLINLVKIFGDFMYRNKVKKDKSLIERTKESGIRSIDFFLGRLLFNNFTLFPIFLIQNLFLKTDLGVGYIVLAKKRS